MYMKTILIRMISKTKTGFNNLKLSNKLAIIYSVVVVIPIIVVGLYSYRISENAITSEVTKLIENDFDRSAERIDNYLKSWLGEMNRLTMGNTLTQRLSENYSDNIPGFFDFKR